MNRWEVNTKGGQRESNMTPEQLAEIRARDERLGQVNQSLDVWADRRALLAYVDALRSQLANKADREPPHCATCGCGMDK